MERRTIGIASITHFLDKFGSLQRVVTMCLMVTIMNVIHFWLHKKVGKKLQRRGVWYAG